MAGLGYVLDRCDLAAVFLFVDEEKMAATNTHGLTEMQEAFCHEYLKTRIASDAYRAVYSTENMSPKTVNEAASRLLSSSKISARLDALRSEQGARRRVDLEYLSDELAAAAIDAAADGNHSARVAALVNLGKLHGIFVEKTHNMNEDLNQSHLEALRGLIDKADNVKRLEPKSDLDADDVQQNGTTD